MKLDLALPKKVFLLISRQLVIAINMMRKNFLIVTVRYLVSVVVINQLQNLQLHVTRTDMHCIICGEQREGLIHACCVRISGLSDDDS